MGKYDSARPAQHHETAGVRSDGVPRFRDRVTVNRLIVLVPEEGADGTELARRIWALAAPCELKVFLLCALGANTEREPAMRLRLATLASLIRDDHVKVTGRVTTGQSWIRAVRDVWQPGDLVLCYAEHPIPTRWWGMQPLGQVLATTLELPVYFLTGMEPRPQLSALTPPETKSRSRLLYWTGLLVLVAGFLIAQAQIDLLASGFLHTLLFVTAIVVELGLIALWTLQ